MKEKRKTRLNKTQGTKTEFVGFGAFADAALSGGATPSKQATLRWSPIYTGKDSDLATAVFPRLLKRDATTKCKALQELQHFFRQDNFPKKQQVDALAHYMFLYHSKLTYESSSSVRSEALLALILAAQRVPKAFSILVQQNNRQVLGMMYCCHGDPTAEVRTMASKNMAEKGGGQNAGAYSLEDLESGLWDYVQRILSYGRANNMQEDLFAKSCKPSNSKNGNSTEELNESQRDEMDERFERIVGTALSGLQIWISRQGILSENNPLISTSHNFVWKTMSSPQSSLRNRTFALLATCCQKAPSIIFDNQQAFSQTLPQALLSEKEAGNIATLLEALLAFLAAYMKHNSSSSAWDNCLNAGNVVKSLVKIFKKSCFAAAAKEWENLLLPLLAMLPSLSDQIAVLSATWKGREETVRLGDQLVVVRTVSESASFFLLRKMKGKTEQPGKEEDVKALVQLWAGCLECFLETKMPKTSRGGGPLEQAQLALAKGLATEILQLNEDQPLSVVHPIRDWLWQEKVRHIIWKAEGYDALAMLVQQIVELQGSHPFPESMCSSYLFSILSEKFREVLSAFQDRSGDVPTMDAYAVMIAILRCFGIQVLDQTSGESNAMAEKFLMNDVLRWMVIHTSSFSTQQQTKALAQKDFALFGICAVGLPSGEMRSKLWETLLKELIAAKCRLDLLLAGLRALLRQDKTWKEKAQCDLLDQFAIQVVGDAMQDEGILDKAGDSDEEEDETRTALEGFLRTVSGINPGIPPLIRPSIVSSWVDMTCDYDNAIIPRSVLGTLVALAAEPTRLADDEVLRVVLQCWRQGGQVWTEDALRLLSRVPCHCSALFDRAPKILESILSEWSDKAEDQRADEVAKQWEEMAQRLLALTRESSCAATPPTPSLKLVKLAEVSVWESEAGRDFPFACLMRLLGNAASPVERLRLLQQSEDGDATDFIVRMLISLSGASSAGISASRTSRQQDRCAQLLTALGGRSGLGKQLLQSWLRACVARIAQLSDKGDSGKIQKAVAVVSQLSCLLVDRVKAVDILSASDAEEDDDDRLSEEFEREKLSKLIVPVLGSKSFAALPWSSCIAELVNVVVFHCGVGGERGIGSLHYDVFQLILGAEGRLRKQLSNLEDVKQEEVIQEIWILALSCGFGLNTPFSEWNSLLAFQPDKITGPILEYYDKQANGGAFADLGRAVLVWLITASPALTDKDTLSRSLKHLHNECISILAKSLNFDDDSLLAVRGIHVANQLSRKKNIDVESLATQAIMQTVAAFVGQWETSSAQRGVVNQAFDANCQPIRSVQPAWRELSHFNEIVSFTISEGRDLVTSGTSDFVDVLVSALFDPSKRWYAFRLLDAIASSTQIQGDPTPGEETTRRLCEWSKELDDEAKSELEEDVEIVSEILPNGMMAEMEKWVEEEYDSLDALDADYRKESIIIGRMMVWLSCLHFVDCFVRKDPSNRPSLCAYLDKSGASESILNQTLLHTGVGTQKGAGAHQTVDVNQLQQTESLLDKVSLASLVLFRTVETLPPLSRRWWEQECPNVYTTPIRDYIEVQVAPKILEKELERLKFATIKNPALSALTVTGSVTTREITATYAQDEINLKVSIVLPSFYPLRNAEVDCSQTLGIPAKRWKLWSLQITMMLNNQGGTLQEALMLWKENVDQEFEGVEPCPVCYSVLHVKTHKLPELECATCQNRFHAQCLTQWFRSSGKTQCVLCQQAWVGTKVKR